MRTKNYLSLFFTVVFSTVSAQQKLIDSLELQLKNPTNGNTRLQNLIQLGGHYSRINPQKGLRHVNEAIEIATKKKNSFQLGQAYDRKGLNLISLGKDSLALSYMDKAEKEYLDIDSTRALSKLLLYKAIFHQRRSNHPDAIEILKLAFENFEKDNDTLMMGYTFGLIGSSNTDLGNYTSSLEYLLNGASLLEKSNQEDSKYYVFIQSSLGALYLSLIHI